MGAFQVLRCWRGDRSEIDRRPHVVCAHLAGLAARETSLGGFDLAGLPISWLGNGVEIQCPHVKRDGQRGLASRLDLKRKLAGRILVHGRGVIAVADLSGLDKLIYRLAICLRRRNARYGGCCGTGRREGDEANRKQTAHEQPSQSAHVWAQVSGSTILFSRCGRSNRAMLPGLAGRNHHGRIVPERTSAAGRGQNA